MTRISCPTQLLANAFNLLLLPAVCFSSQLRGLACKPSMYAFAGRHAILGEKPARRRCDEFELGVLCYSVKTIIRKELAIRLK